MRIFSFCLQRHVQTGTGKKDVLGFTEDRRGLAILTDVNFHIPMFREA